MGKNKRISDTTLPVLWESYQSHKDVETRNKLIEHYRPLVHMIAARMRQKLPGDVSFDELCSAGYDGLIECVERYSPDSKAKFESYSQLRILGAMNDWLREMDQVPRTIRNYDKKRNASIDTLLSHGEPICDQTVLEKMSISEERYLQQENLSRRGNIVSLDAPYGGNSDAADMTFGDFVADGAIDPSEELMRKTMVDHFTCGLNRESKLILTLYYVEDLTMKEVGHVLDLSESRVSQIHKEAIGYIRRQLHREEYH